MYNIHGLCFGSHNRAIMRMWCNCSTLTQFNVDQDEPQQTENKVSKLNEILFYLPVNTYKVTLET